MWDWYCGSLDMQMCAYVASLRSRYATAILSNSADGARREEQSRWGFEDLVDVVIYSHEVGLAKPDPRIYELACERLGVRPVEMVFVDDVAAIVDSAARFGIRAVLHEADAAWTIEAIDALLTATD
jgi:putative hydrolase of the HAD superfamily